MTWPIVFMLVVLKIPVLYLCAVIWWAIRSEPRPEAPAALVPVFDLDPPARSWWLDGRARRRPPRGPVRRPPSRSASMRMRTRR